MEGAYRQLGATQIPLTGNPILESARNKPIGTSSDVIQYGGRNLARKIGADRQIKR